MADDLIRERVPDPPEPDPERVAERAEEMDSPGTDQDVDDAERSARALLRESEARTVEDPAPYTLEDDRVERRKSEDTAPPTDAP
jgi:hypothetical protein